MTHTEGSSWNGGAVPAEPQADRKRDVFRPAGPGAIRLGGYIGARIDQCAQNRVMRQDIGRLVEPFRLRNERDYGGFRCEYWGKWLTSAALAYAYEPTSQYRAKLDAAVAALLETQTPDGYIGTYEPGVRLGGWDVWGRKYVLLGLLAYHEATGDAAALRAAESALDCLLSELDARGANVTAMGFPGWKGLPPSSILEPVVLLSRRTGRLNFLEFAKGIVAAWREPNELARDGLRLVEETLAETPPAAIGAPKAYEMMSCYEGLCELYRATGEARYRDAAQKLAEGVIRHERMVTGSGSNQELWGQGARHQTEILEQPVETCVTVTWMKLCYQLLRLTGESRWADELEVSLYNALLAAMTPDGAWWSYYAPLTGERVPSLPQHKDVGLSCCVASGPRGLLLTPRWAVMASAEGPVVNLYAPGRADIELPGGATVGIEQSTSYPVNGDVSLVIRMEAPAAFTLRLRIPAWSKETRLRVNGEPLACAPGRYAEITRTWTDGDAADLRFDMRGRAIPAPSGAPCNAVMRGPIVLALDSRLAPAEDTAMWLLAHEDGGVALTPSASPPEDVWMAFEAAFEVRPSHVFEHHQRALTLCDYASAGNAWSGEDLFRVWLPQPLFLRAAYPQNTWRLMYPGEEERPVAPA